MTASDDSDRGVMPVIGNILLVAVVVIIAVTVAGLSFAFLENTGTPTGEASFDFEQTPAGMEVVPNALGTDVTVELNGQAVETIDADSAGQSVLVPTAPGDTVTVISTDKERSVLVREEIDERSEVGDFVAYYTFDQRKDRTVHDRSGNGNDGGMNGGVSRVGAGSGTALEFDGSTGTYVNVGDLTVEGPSEVEEMTIAITYEHDGGSDIQNLIEHQDANFAWFMETDSKHDDPHQMEFNVGYQTAESGKLTTGDVAAGEKQVLVGTYDGEKMVFYRNGVQVGSTPLDREVALGEVILGADSDPTSVGQNLDGRIYEVRLYYTAFDGQEASRLTTVMS